jgi:hypothetical protein
MKYLILALIGFMFCGEALARPMVTIDDNETVVIATLAKGGAGLWLGSVKLTGDFGDGTVSLKQADASNCTTRVVTLKAGETAYSATAADFVSVELGTKPNDSTYLCATMAGATSPDVTVQVLDGR